MTQDELQEDEYLHRKYIFHIDVKNNIGIANKFFGSQYEFDVTYKQYFNSDTYGKITGVNKTEYVNKVDDNIINDKFSPFYGMSKNEASKLSKKNTNKRYWRYL